MKVIQLEVFKTVFLGKKNVSADIYAGEGKGIGMWGAKVYSFLAVLVCKRVSILTISV